MTTYKHSFECKECSERPPQDFFHFPPTDCWAIAYLEKRVIHIHFGTATTNENESTKETEWLHNAVTSIGVQHPTTNFFVLIDTSRADDSEFPSDRSQELYKEMLANPQNELAVFYGPTPAMRFFIAMLIRLAGVGDKVKIAKNRADADSIYEEWAKKPV